MKTLAGIQVLIERDPAVCPTADLHEAALELMHSMGRIAKCVQERSIGLDVDSATMRTALGLALIDLCRIGIIEGLDLDTAFHEAFALRVQ